MLFGRRPHGQSCASTGSSSYRFYASCCSWPDYSGFINPVHFTIKIHAYKISEYTHHKPSPFLPNNSLFSWVFVAQPREQSCQDNSLLGSDLPNSPRWVNGQIRFHSNGEPRCPLFHQGRPTAAVSSFALSFISLHLIPAFATCWERPQALASLIPSCASYWCSDDVMWAKNRGCSLPCSTSGTCLSR